MLGQHCVRSWFQLGVLHHILKETLARGSTLKYARLLLEVLLFRFLLLMLLKSQETKKYLSQVTLPAIPSQLVLWIMPISATSLLHLACSLLT